MKKLKNFIFALTVLGFLYFAYILAYTFVEPKIYDYMTELVLTNALPFDNHKNVYGHDDIVLVVIDDKTHQKYRWPWKRELNCKIFEYFLNYTQPKAVVHDSIVSVLDRDNPDSDRKFFATLNKFDNLISGFVPKITKWENSEFGKIYDEKFADKFSIKNIDNKGTSGAVLFSSLIPFPDEYFNVIKNVGTVFVTTGFLDGNISMMCVDDDILRTYNYIVNYKGKFYPSLALKTFLTVNNNPRLVLKNDSIEFPELDYKISQKTTFFQMIVPIKFYKFHGLNSDSYGYTHQKYSAVDIMDSYDNIIQGKKPIINPDVFKDKIVIIGVNAAADGLNDVRNTSLSANHPGVDIQATVIDNIIHNDFLKIVPKWLNILIMLLGMLFVFYTIKTHELVKAISYTILIALIYLAASATCFYYGVVINVITPVVLFVITMIIGYVNRYLIENKKKEQVESAMSKFMSEDVMKGVLKNIDNLGLGGKKSVVTVLFSDIRGFTSLSEKMSAYEVSALLNEYFSEMEPIVSKYNGIINKFIGDAIMAVFGEPIQDENHPSNAVMCGYEMLKKVQELDEKWRLEGKPEIKIGIGINTGEVFVGNVGSEKRMEYTVIGDTVNLASRLESYNKTYQTSMLISSSTYDASKDIVKVNKIPDVEIRGKSHKIDIYEVIETQQQ